MGFLIAWHTACWPAASGQNRDVSVGAASFFASMLITNDIALITFVPFAL